VKSRAALHEAVFVKHDTNPPKFFDVTLLTPREERSIRVASDQHIWDAAFEQGVELPALCHQGWCLTCAGRIEGQGEVDQADSLAFFPQDREAGFGLLCTGRPCSDLTIRTHRAVEMRKHRLKDGLPSPYSQGLKP
jgi:ferredoxin